MFSDIFRNVERSRLINEIVQPVGIDERGVRAPLHYRLLCGVVVREIVPGDLRLKSLVEIAPVFQSDGVRVVFRMPGDEELTAVLAANRVYSCLLGYRHDLELRHLLDILPAHLGVP